MLLFWDLNDGLWTADSELVNERALVQLDYAK